MPRPTKSEMERMAKTGKPRSATVIPRPVVVDEVPSSVPSVRLRHRPQTSPPPPLPSRKHTQAKKMKKPWEFTIEWDLAEQFRKIANEMTEHGARYAVGVATGTAVGLFVLGWWMFPPPLENTSLESLSPLNKAVTVYVAADLAAFDPNSPTVLQLANAWTEMDDEACVLAALESDVNKTIRLQSLAYRLNGVGCPLPTE